jgi:outer membrane lipoprotein carrier protein
MKLIYLLLGLSVYLNADLSTINSFEADFTQTINNENTKELRYKGHMIATKPQYALWSYLSPVKKDIYISMYKLTTIEPDMEQVIIQNISSEFNLFTMLKDAKKIKKDTYTTQINNVKYTIKTKNDTIITSISYTDELDYKINIIFTNQELNKKIDVKLFHPQIPSGYDIITP